MAASSSSSTSITHSSLVAFSTAYASDRLPSKKELVSAATPPAIVDPHARLVSSAPPGVTGVGSYASLDTSLAGLLYSMAQVRLSSLFLAPI